MPDISVQTAIDRARAVIGDDHNETEGAVPNAAWVTFFQPEYARAYSALARRGAVPVVANGIGEVVLADSTPGPVSFTAGEVLAVQDVIDISGGAEYRVLLPAQPGMGQYPFDGQAGDAVYFAVYGHAAGAQVQLYPNPGPTSGRYYVRYVPGAAQLVAPGATPGTGESGTISGLPDCAIDRVVLGAARRALVRTAQVSPGIERLIALADEETGMWVAGRLSADPPRVRNTDGKYRGWARRGQDLAPSTLDPTAWRWLL